jgi:pimeloyl-ACP methyl ester carboxylesterase
MMAKRDGGDMSATAVRLGRLILLGMMSLLSFGCDVLPDSATANASLKERVNWYDKESSSAQLHGSCAEIPDLDGARYCRYQTGPNPQYTIWFFHGAGDSERVFEYSPFSRDSYIELEQQLGAAVDIVTISYGPVWLLTDVTHRSLEPKDATVEIFETKIVKFLLGLGLTKPYVAMGHSQGGANVATICAALPDMWSKCVLLNPMLPSCDPFSPWPICPPAPALAPLGAFGPNFLVRANYTKAEWPTAQPMVLLTSAKTRATRNLPQFLVTACKSDEFGLYSGPKAWADKAAKLGFVSEWVEGKAGCNHFHWPAGAVAKFLQKK